MKSTTRNVLVLGLMSLLSLNVMSQGAFAAQAQTPTSKNDKTSTAVNAVHKNTQQSLKKKTSQQNSKKPASHIQSRKPTNLKQTTTKGASDNNVVAKPTTPIKK
ncbi:hypothetical protein F7734_07075 [Scytonema sp. UIC 10036]|uniref:hypothetical protein n=1 Tax=Scytonema sp. UIC 10036 TaxID=2304196 RepID=UPI0012DAD710|nr:hypothetical protein [Scytonema sp. UIC 10036]MUG92233.1 hypothetical protein [Scytonema sp. UIC 10036]